MTTLLPAVKPCATTVDTLTVVLFATRLAPIKLTVASVVVGL